MPEFPLAEFGCMWAGCHQPALLSVQKLQEDPGNGIPQMKKKKASPLFARAMGCSGCCCCSSGCWDCAAPMCLLGMLFTGNFILTCVSHPHCAWSAILVEDLGALHCRALALGDPGGGSPSSKPFLWRISSLHSADSLLGPG